MEIVIDTSGSVPMFAQLIEQIKEAVLNGELSPGSALPSIRQLANDLEMNHNTVAKAYRFLERDSVIQTRGYRGTVIHPDARANSTVDLNQWVTSKLSEAITEFRESDVTDSEIRIAFANVMKNQSKQGD
jgi:GntR family transcriptional regulator